MIDAPASFEVDGKQYPAGTRIIPMAQPYGAFAKTLLERQRYPDLREYPGGPPRRPYDVTAHTLPLLMAVDAVRIDRPFRLSQPQQIIGSRGESTGDTREVRVGLYKSHAASMDEGWTRWVFDQYKNEPLGFKISYKSLTDVDIRAGRLELKLVAKGTQVPYQTKEQADAAAKSIPPGGDPYNSQWQSVYYRDRSDASGTSTQGWVVVATNPVVTGLDMRNVSATQSDWARSEYQIDFSLSPDGAARLSNATSKHIGNHLAVVVGGEVKSAPTDQQPDK